MAFDFKKEYKEFYFPPAKPSLVDVPPMNYIAVRGKGNPNDEDGEYKASRKKKKDFSKVEFFHYEEGKCVQCMHIGSYDMEPTTIEKIKAFAAQEGLSIAIDENRRHHELYLSDPRKTVPDKLKTVIRYPVRSTLHL